MIWLIALSWFALSAILGFLWSRMGRQVFRDSEAHMDEPRESIHEPVVGVDEAIEGLWATVHNTADFERAWRRNEGVKEEA